MYSHNDTQISLLLADEIATVTFAAHLAPTIKAGIVIYLRGDLGAGKTTLVRALMHAMGHTGRVSSPTYSLLESYQIGKLHLRHFDLYRFNDASEWEAAGFRDEFNGENVCLIEWPERAQHLIPMADMEITLEVSITATGCNGRNLTVRAISQTGLECLNLLRN